MLWEHLVTSPPHSQMKCGGFLADNISFQPWMLTSDYPAAHFFFFRPVVVIDDVAWTLDAASSLLEARSVAPADFQAGIQIIVVVVAVVVVVAAVVVVVVGVVLPQDRALREALLLVTSLRRCEIKIRPNSSFNHGCSCVPRPCPCPFFVQSPWR
ncbi:unnamed protein product [Polarella glacialis]|uniref:Uncharacterized protein n=1 Tax=Polarella glacialis TaxID=89957 RepID=A0A813KP50_POLGL|nr:unnamed protein product [Polarella glacialis]